MKANRTIVSVLSQQAAPNYLVIRELFQKGDSLLFISSRTMFPKLKMIESCLADLEGKVSSVVFSDDDAEEKWNLMCREIEARLTKDSKYLVNLTGGTKFMGLAIQKVFEKYDAQFYYLPLPKNYLLRPMQSDDEKTPLKYRLRVKEYMELHGLKLFRYADCPSQAKSYTDGFSDFFLNRLGKDAEVIEKLRKYRDKDLKISDVEKAGNDQFPQIERLSEFLNRIAFPLREAGFLSKHEARYLTGGWFEEYIFSFVKEHLQPDDVMLDVTFKTENNELNELDVVFTLNNKLYVIECKTGGVNRAGEAAPIIYKAAALKKFFGLAANTIIFSLSSHNPSRAEDFEAQFFDRSYFVEADKFDRIKEEILHLKRRTPGFEER